MADYKAMYLRTFNTITDVIKILQEIQRETEEMYVKNSEDDNA